MENVSEKQWIFIFGFGVTLILICHLIIQSLYIADVPYHDDHRWGIYFLNRLYETHGFFQKARLFFSPHNEHRLVLTRLVLWLDQSIHFKTIGFGTTLLALGLVGVFYGQCKWIIFPVIPFLFNWSYYHLYLCSYGYSNLGVCLFAAITAQALAKRSVGVAFLWASLASCTNSNGRLTRQAI
ncbi:MAG: hypothetical protein QM669_15640, partial [Siphonobacter sp.]